MIIPFNPWKVVPDPYDFASRKNEFAVSYELIDPEHAEVVQINMEDGIYEYRISTSDAEVWANRKLLVGLRVRIPAQDI